MDDQTTTETAQSNPHWKGDPSKASGPESEGSLSIPARALDVTWGNDPRYWEWLKFSDTESKVAGFEEGAVLQQVNWLEVRGEVEAERLREGASYRVYFVMKFTNDAFGWSHAPIKFMVMRWDESESRIVSEREVRLDKYGEEVGTWHRVWGGEFKVVGKGKGKVEVGMFEVETEWWKGGMILGGICIHPT